MIAQRQSAKRSPNAAKRLRSAPPATARIARATSRSHARPAGRNDALGTLLASAVARRVSPAGAPAGLLQRANDKFAITFEATAASTAVDELTRELQAIYGEQRRVKKEARAQLDVAHQSGIANLEKRQVALAERALPVVNKKFNAALLGAAGLKLSEKAPSADAMKWATEVDANKVAEAVFATPALQERAKDSVRAKAEMADGAKTLGADIEARLDKLSGLHDGEIASRARAIIERSVQQFGVTLAKRPVKASKSQAFGRKLGEAVRASQKEGFDLDKEVTKFESEEQVFVREKLVKLGTKDAVTTPHPYAQLDADAASQAELVLGALAVGVANAKAQYARAAQIGADVNTTTIEHARHHLADPLVSAYEKGFLATGMDLAKLKRAWLEAAEKKGFSVSFRRAPRGHEIVLTDGGGSGQETVLGKLFEDDERFVPVSAHSTTIPAHVHYHVESNEQYVKDASDLFVRRFVSRCLNEYDNPTGADEIKISVDPRVKKDTTTSWGDIALDLPSKPEKHRDEEIWGHQRKKELQGGSPFVSFTTSKHAIFGSTAKYFEDPKWGVATVDLAHVPKERIVDTHQQRAYKRITGLEKPEPDMPFRENDEAVEKNTAARDAMRTRELVVIGSLPPEAVVKFDRFKWDSSSSTFVPTKTYTRAQTGDRVKFTPT